MVPYFCRNSFEPARAACPTSWRTFLRRHRGALVAADFFTTEVWRASELRDDAGQKPLQHARATIPAGFGVFELLPLSGC